MKDKDDVLENVLRNQIIKLLSKNNKLNQKQIAAKPGKSIASVQRTMKRLSEQEIERSGIDMVWWISRFEKK